MGFSPGCTCPGAWLKEPGGYDSYYNTKSNSGAPWFLVYSVCRALSPPIISFDLPTALLKYKSLIQNGHHLHFIDEKTLPQGFRPEENGGWKDAHPGSQTRRVTSNHGPLLLALAEVQAPRLGWEERSLGLEAGGRSLQEEESVSERTLALGPTFCLGHCFLIIKLLF